MGVDARMLVKLAAPISDDALSDACYRLAEACGKYDVFWLSDDDDLQRGERRRALNRCTADDAYRRYGVAEPDGLWLFVSLWGRYYGPSYERGDLWSFIAIAEWCERNLPGCFVFYGGDSGGTLEPFNRQARERFIAHWAAKGGRPYYAGEGRTYPAWYGGEHPLRPACPLCERPATQYGSGQQFASWSCDGCSRHWVWVGGETVKAFKPSRDFDSFIAAKEMRESPPSADAVDPQVSSTGTPSPREKELEEKIQSLCRALEGRPLQRDQALRNRVSAMAESWGLKDSLDPQMVRRVLRLLLQMPADEALQLCVCGYTYDSHEFGPEGTRTAGLSRVEAGDWHHFEWAAVECPSGSAALEGRPREITVDELKDMLQLAANKGAFICPLAGRNDKPEKHDYFCAACRVRGLLTPGWYVAPETEMADRATEDREALRWEHITRLEVITEDGRQYVGRNRSIEPSLQDDGRTLKLFLTARAQADEGGRLQAQAGPQDSSACTTTATEEQTSGEGTPPTPGSPRA